MSVRPSVLLILVLAACQAGPPSSSSVPTASGSASPSEMLSASDTPSAEPASGRIVFSRYDPALDNSVVYLIDPNGTTESLLLPGAHECPRWSPDGNDISLGWGIFENAGQPNGAFRAFTTLEHTRYLPDPTLNLGCPIWSPDGSRLAYQGWDDTDPTRNGIYTLNASDGGDLQRLTSNPNGGDLPGDYSADGTELFFMRVSGNHEQGPLMVVGMDGSDARMVTTNAFGAPSLSPDGQTLLASRSGSLYLITLDGSLATPIEILNTTLDADQPAWSPDGSWILFSLRADLGADIARVRPDGTGLFQITHDPADEGAADWAP